MYLFYIISTTIRKPKNVILAFIPNLIRLWHKKSHNRNTGCGIQRVSNYINLFVKCQHITVIIQYATCTTIAIIVISFCTVRYGYTLRTRRMYEVKATVFFHFGYYSNMSYAALTVAT